MCSAYTSYGNDVIYACTGILDHEAAGAKLQPTSFLSFMLLFLLHFLNYVYL